MVLLLELARGIAALWVFFFHVKEMFLESSPLIYQFSSHGSLGVPMFFVISGFAITHSAELNVNSQRSPAAFLKARFLRIYPAFWASVLVVLLLPYLVELISSLKSGEYVMPHNLLLKYSGIDWIYFLTLIKVFWASSHDLQSQFNAINSVYWTLAIEFQFYLLVFAALFFKKYFRHFILFVSVVALLLILVPNKVHYGLFIHYWPSFSVGVGLAYLHKYGITASLLFKNKALRVLLTISAVLFLIYTIKFDGSRSLLFATGFGLFLWAVADLEVIFKRINDGSHRLGYWSLQAWLVLGAMSYSVYLLHGKIYQLPNMFVRQVIDANNLLFGLATIFLTLILCFPFYVFVERPFMSKRYKAMQNRASDKAGNENSET